MISPAFAAGIDIGGTRVKMGIVELATGRIAISSVFDTEKSSEGTFWDSIGLELDRQAAGLGISKSELAGAGISIGSYVFPDGSIDGMVSFIPFLTPAYPMRGKAEEILGLPVKIDNDARLIALAEAVYGSGRGSNRSLTITLGTGIGIGFCIDGKLPDEGALIHLAGHIKVRSGGEITCLDSTVCYCGLRGCFESTCSGSSLEKYVKDKLGPEYTNQKMFELAGSGAQNACSCLNWYIGMLSEALNQYVYVYAPDVIILSGGISKALSSSADELNRKITAEVYSGQRTRVCISSLLEDGGILGGASLFLDN